MGTGPAYRSSIQMFSCRGSGRTSRGRQAGCRSHRPGQYRPFQSVDSIPGRHSKTGPRRIKPRRFPASSIQAARFAAWSQVHHPVTSDFNDMVHGLCLLLGDFRRNGNELQPPGEIPAGQALEATRLGLEEVDSPLGDPPHCERRTEPGPHRRAQFLQAFEKVMNVGGRIAA